MVKLMEQLRKLDKEALITECSRLHHLLENASWADEIPLATPQGTVKAHVITSFLGRYVVCSIPGVNGTHGIFFPLNPAQQEQIADAIKKFPPYHSEQMKGVAT